MNIIDACVLAILAVADLALLIRLRSRRNRTARIERVNRSLEFAVRRELYSAKPFQGDVDLLRAS